MPTTITAGQTPLLMSDFITRVKSEDKGFKVTDPAPPDFYTPMAFALPVYAADYEGSYYEVPSDTADPTNVPAAETTSTLGSVYELPLPTACINDSVSHLFVKYGPAEVPTASITNEEDESAWVPAAGVVYWRHAGRKLRAFIGSNYSSSTAYSVAHKRYPNIPSTSSDPIDAPAEDINTLYTAWRAKLVKP